MTVSPPVKTPFTILVSGAEQARYFFTGLHTDADQGGRPLVVQTEWAHLKTGDYSIAGMEELVTVERKTVSDLLGTLGGGRERFQREHERMAMMTAAMVVVESTWPEIINTVHAHGVSAKAAYRTWLSWQIEYGVPWVAVGPRRLAEVTTFRFLEKFWEKHGEEKCT